MYVLILLLVINLCLMLLCAVALAIHGLLTRIAAALSDEGLRTEAAIESGTWPWLRKLFDKIRLRRYYPSGRIPKF